MVAAPRAASVAEDQDSFLVVHEGRSLGEIGRGGAVLDRQAVALADDAPRAPRHLGNHAGPEPLHDLIERTRHGRERGELLDQAVAAGNGLAAFDRLAVAIDGPGGEIAFGIGEGLVELNREGVREIVEHVLARSYVDLDIAPILSRNLRKAPL